MAKNYMDLKPKSGFGGRCVVCGRKARRLSINGLCSQCFQKF